MCDAQWALVEMHWCAHQPPLEEGFWWLGFMEYAFNCIYGSLLNAGHLFSLCFYKKTGFGFGCAWVIPEVAF